jgi:hypothetical protein
MFYKLFYIPYKTPFFFGLGHEEDQKKKVFYKGCITTLSQHQCRIKLRVGAFSK